MRLTLTLWELLKQSGVAGCLSWMSKLPVSRCHSGTQPLHRGGVVCMHSIASIFGMISHLLRSYPVMQYMPQQEEFFCWSKSSPAGASEVYRCYGCCCRPDWDDTVSWLKGMGADLVTTEEKAKKELGKHVFILS